MVGATHMKGSGWSGLRSRGRLSEALCGVGADSVRALVVCDYNLTAVESVYRFLEGREPLVALVGSSGWGKSALLFSAAEHLSLSGGRYRAVWGALDWIRSAERPECPHPLVLDDLQDAVRNPRARHTLRQRLEKRVRLHRPTLVSFTEGGASSGLPQVLPMGQEWAIARLGKPEIADRAAVVAKIAENEGVALSEATVWLIARHLFGNGRSIQGALQRLGLVRRDWLGERSVCEACGVLMPYLMGRDGWDPRDVVAEAVLSELGRRGVVDVRTASDVTAYVLTTLIGLSEQDVAVFLRMTPSQVYARQNAVKARLSDLGSRRLVEACESAVLSAFAKV